MTNPLGPDFALPAHDTPPLRPVRSAVVAEWPEGTFLENLAPAPTYPGSWLVTITSHNRIDRVDPGGKHDTVVELPNTVTGIATTDLGTFFLTGVLGAPGWQLARLDESAAGHATVCDVPDLVLGNGLTWDGHRLLAVDSGLGHLVAIDPVARTSSVWLAHELLTKLNPETPLPVPTASRCTRVGSTSPTVNAPSCCAARWPATAHPASWRWWPSGWAATTSTSTRTGGYTWPRTSITASCGSTRTGSAPTSPA